MMISAGARLGPYEVLGPLGAGGMGEVWRARDTRLSREVAIKVLPAEVAADPARLRRFEREARSASALNHPNIVTIFDIGTSDSVWWIAMERVEGKTLRELLFTGPLSTKRLLQIAAQVADGLARAHEAGIVHRDLKPENVMVTRDALVKLLDFGLAKSTSTSDPGEGSHLPTETGTAPGIVLGTVGYMSPEQAAGQPVDFRSDQFSLGAILYEMVTGKRAFLGKTGVDTLAAILNHEPEPLGVASPSTPAPLRWIVERCLAKDREGRYASTRDLARDLSTLRDHPFESRVAESGLSRGFRGPLRSLGWLSLVLAAVVAGVFIGRALRKEPPPASHPRFQQLTFPDETIYTARFAPDEQAVVYGSVRQGKLGLYSTRIGSLESHSLGLNADILSVSSSGDMAVRLGGPEALGTLATMPLTGGQPRQILESVRRAAWGPNGKDLAVERLVDGKERLEFPIGRVLMETTGFVGHPRFSRDGGRILFRHGNALAVADLGTQKIRTLPEIPRLTGYGWSPGGDEIWFSADVGANSELRATWTGGGERLIAALPAWCNVQDIAPNGRILLEIGAPRQQMLAGASGQPAERSMSWLDGSEPADITPDGRTVLFTESGPAVGGLEYVYVRRADGSDAVRLGEGFALAISPDGNWAITRRDLTALMPTSAGELRLITAGGIRFGGGATFFPDGKRVLLTGSAAGRGSRLYEWPLAGGDPRAVTPEGVSLPERAHTISPDGKLVAAVGPKDVWGIYSLEGGASPARPIAGLLAQEKPIRWSADGRFLFVLDGAGKVSRLDPASGRREPFKAFPAGAVVLPTPDGAAYVYGYGEQLSHLFLAEGLR